MRAPGVLRDSGVTREVALVYIYLNIFLLFCGTEILLINNYAMYQQI